MKTTKFHQIVTWTGIISFAALAIIGIVCTLFGTFDIDPAVPDWFVGVFVFLLSTFSILSCFCLPVSALISLVSIAGSLRSKRESTCGTDL